MDPHLRQLVVRRAKDRCEYCRIAQNLVPFQRFHVEHIVAKQHGGGEDSGNLCLACHRCNGYKGPNLAAIDPDTGEVVSLFHPRHDSWHEHFTFRGAEIVGLTPTGRATLRLLKMNDYWRVLLRAELIALGDLPDDSP